MNTFAFAESPARNAPAHKSPVQVIFPQHDTRFPAATQSFLDLGPGQYQVALVSMGARADSKSAMHVLAIPQLLLLPLTWDDLLNHIHSDSLHPSAKSSSDITQFGEVHIDFKKHEIRRAGRPVELTAFDFKVLRFFVVNPHRVISREELLDSVWGYSHYPTTRTVDNKILRLRQRLEPEPANPVHFLTVHGAGYKFVP